MIALFQWSPLLVGLAAPLLGWLLVAGRANPSRTAVRASLAAALALLVSVPMGVVDFQFLFHGPPNHDLTLQAAVRGADLLFAALTGVLALAAWTLLLAAARAGAPSRLVVFATVFAAALALQAALYYRVATPVILLEEGLNGTT